MKILVCTSNQSAWTLHAFSLLWNRFVHPTHEVTVLCESLESLSKLPANFKPVQAGETWPKEQWTNGLIRYLNSIPDQQVLIMLDDYWLLRQVDWAGLLLLELYMKSRANVLRMDLTADRMFALGPRYPHEDPIYETCGHFDLVCRPQTQYQMSLQPGLWNKSALLNILQDNWDPWEVELAGTPRVNESQFVVVGTRQDPIRIVNALKYKFDKVNLTGLSDEIVDWLRLQNALPADREYERRSTA